MPFGRGCDVQMGTDLSVWQKQKRKRTPSSVRLYPWHCLRLCQEAYCLRPPGRSPASGSSPPDPCTSEDPPPREEEQPWKKPPIVAGWNRPPWPPRTMGSTAWRAEADPGTQYSDSCCWFSFAVAHAAQDTAASASAAAPYQHCWYHRLHLCWPATAAASASGGYQYWPPSPRFGRFGTTTRRENALGGLASLHPWVIVGGAAAAASEDGPSGWPSVPPARQPDGRWPRGRQPLPSWPFGSRQARPVRCPT